MFDLEEESLSGIAAKVVETLIAKGYIDKDEGEKLNKDLLLGYKPVDEKRKLWLGSRRQSSLQVKAKQGLSPIPFTFSFEF